MKTYIETLDKEKVISKFDSILERGLCVGIGKIDGQMCIEAAITQALDLPFSDQPECVAESVKTFKIVLNDKNWSSPQKRAKALRNLGIAQIGSKGIVNSIKFCKLLSKKSIQILIPTLFREIFVKDNILHKNCLKAALECEKNPIKENVLKAKDAAAAAAYVADANAAAYAAAAADAAAYAADAAAYAADAAAYAADAADAAASKTKDKYLILVTDLALEVLKELKSPGCEWL